MDEKNDQPPMIRHYRGVTKTIVERHFGKPASRIVYKSSGRTNFVFAVNHVEGQFVIRISPNAENIHAFRKELWASQKAREAGVPSPEVLAVEQDGLSEPYMITRRVTGAEATHHPKRHRIIHEMGRYAATINSITTTGFGCNFEWTDDGPTQSTWNSYVKEEFEIDKRLELFARHQILPEPELQEISRIVENAKPGDGNASLNHCDLRLKNVIVDEGGDIAAIIDWEECMSTIAPQFELSIALHDLSIDEKHAFIDGYGLSSGQVKEMAPLIKAFNILNYSRVIEQAIADQDDKNLAAIKLRLIGSLDLYSL
jgi:hygromycin-B 4-O-kinase